MAACAVPVRVELVAAPVATLAPFGLRPWNERRHHEHCQSDSHGRADATRGKRGFLDAAIHHCQSASLAPSCGAYQCTLGPARVRAFRSRTRPITTFQLSRGLSCPLPPLHRWTSGATRAADASDDRRKDGPELGWERGRAVAQSAWENAALVQTDPRRSTCTPSSSESPSTIANLLRRG